MWQQKIYRCTVPPTMDAMLLQTNPAKKIFAPSKNQLLYNFLQLRIQGGGSRGSTNPPWLVGYFAPPHHLWTNIKTNCCFFASATICNCNSFVFQGFGWATGWLVSARYRPGQMNILLEGIICHQPTITEIQSSRLQTKNSLSWKPVVC